jgi:hypothetical protein
MSGPVVGTAAHRQDRSEGAASSKLQPFESEVLTQEENLAGLAVLHREFIARAEPINCPRRWVVLDMESTEIPVCGEQEQTLTTDTLSPPVTIRCFSNRAQAIAWRRTSLRGNSPDIA